MLHFGHDCAIAVKTPEGNIAWHLDDFKLVLDHVLQSNAVILGGDIITNDWKYTGDNWYYIHTRNSNNIIAAVFDNVRHSIDVAADYLKEYIRNRGSNYLFTIVVASESEAACMVAQCTEADS